MLLAIFHSFTHPFKFFGCDQEPLLVAGDGVARPGDTDDWESHLQGPGVHDGLDGQTLLQRAIFVSYLIFGSYSLKTLK